LLNPEAAHDRTQNLDLALIGNSCAAALVDRNAQIVWWCFPHFDSDPVFSRLLAGDEEKGFTDVVLAALAETQSDYPRNTAIVETILTDAGGAKRMRGDDRARLLRHRPATGGTGADGPLRQIRAFLTDSPDATHD